MISTNRVPSVTRSIEVSGHRLEQGADFELAMGVARYLFDVGGVVDDAADFCDHLDEFRALAEQRAAYRAAPEAAEALAKVGSHPQVPDLDRVEVAAWTMVLSTMMNFDEVVRLR